MAEQIPYRFREAREKAGLSSLEVAKRIGVSQPAVTYWDNGTKPPSIETLCKLADLYCVYTDYLLGLVEPMESTPLLHKPISHEDLGKYKTIWVKSITPDSFFQDELTGWYDVHDFYVQNQYGRRFLYDSYGTKWLAFEMEF